MPSDCVNLLAVLAGSLLILLNIIIFASAVILLTHAYSYRRHQAIQFLLLLTFAFCVISFCSLNVYVNQSFEVQVYFSRMRFVGLALLAPTWLYFISHVFNRWTWLHSRILMTVAYAPAVLTILLTLIPSTRDMVVTDFEPFHAEGLSVVRFQSGPWFLIHLIWSWTLIGASVILGLSILISSKKAREKQSIILLGGCFIPTAIDAYCILTNSPYRWLMLGGAAFAINELAITYAASRHGLLKIVPYAMEKIFSEIPDPILVLDQGDCLQTCNAAAYRLFGLSKKSLGQKISVLLPSVHLYKGEIAIRDTQERERHYSINREILHSEVSESTGSIIFLREITAQKAVENQLSENLEFKARLISLIAHDLAGNIKNQAILASTLKNRVPPDLKEMVELLTDSTFASHDLMSNLLVWAKSQETQFIPQHKKFEIITLLSDCIESLETTLQLKKIEILLPLTKPCIVQADSEMIASILRNLLNNSIQHSGHGTKINIEVLLNDHEFRISVIDQGSGMNSAQVDQLMADTGKSLLDRKSRGHGYGIGLLMARRFVELHGGKFEIESQLGLGTRVSFSIPQ